MYHIVEAADGSLWCSHKGISKIVFDKGYTNPVVTTFDLDNGFSKEMGIIEVWQVNNRILLGTQKGIFRIDEKFNKILPDCTFGSDFCNGRRIAYNLTETRNGDVWVTTNHQTGILRLQPNGSYLYDSLPIIRADVSDIFSIYEDPEGVVWLGGTEALLRYDPKVKKNYHLPFYAIVRKVTVNHDSVLFWGAFADENGVTVFEQPESYVHQLPYSTNHFTFEFAAPFFDAPERTLFSWQLEGQDAEWTQWTDEYSAVYTNLREGSYKFKVRARNIYGTISYIGEYRFIILPPWYRTIWAYILWFALGLAGIWTIVKLNSRRLEAANRVLEKTVEERTAEISAQKKQIEEEQEVSENLLLNILPKETASELKRNQAVKPRYFDQVTVLFADIEGFTRFAEQRSPEDLVKDLHEVFTRFDEITTACGIEKIKTIGDAYMCAGGLPLPDEKHAVRVVEAALAMQEFVEQLNRKKIAEGRPAFRVRIGIHSGPVVAGIVGTRKFQYDIWGDTVNAAARLESAGESGKINISGVTFELVKAHFHCTPRGMIEVKGKGKIEMYFVRKPVAEDN